MRIELTSLICVLALSGCQIASSTHGGPAGTLLSYPDRSPLMPSAAPATPARTLSIAEQIAPPQPTAPVDEGAPLPTYQPFLHAAPGAPTGTGASARGTGILGEAEAVRLRELPRLAPLPIVEITAIREALARSSDAEAASETQPPRLPASARPVASTGFF